MFRRQKVLLYLILQLKGLEKKISKTYLDKLLFLLKKETNIDDFVKFYNFYPYNYGPFSNQYYFDLSALQSQAYLDADLELKKSAKEINSYLTIEKTQLIDGIVGKYGGFTTERITDYVYENYPAYAQKSILKTQTRQTYAPGIFTIGYEKKDIDSFLDLLIQNHIEKVIDVRANPFSMNFVFTKTKLMHYLEKVGIDYAHFPELGINGEHRKGLQTDSDFEELFDFYSKNILPNQLNKINTLIELGKTKRIALLCFEQNKAYCHRGVLGNILESEGIAVTHL